MPRPGTPEHQAYLRSQWSGAAEGFQRLMEGYEQIARAWGYWSDWCVKGHRYAEEHRDRLLGAVADVERGFVNTDLHDALLDRLG